MHRSRLVVIACIVALSGAALAGCDGVDLAKSSSERTTVPPQPGSGGTGPVPEGPVDAPELTPEKMRLVEACGLLDSDVTDLIGTSTIDPTGSSPDQCTVSLTDRGGKNVSFSLSLGDTLFGSISSATGGIEGLPLSETRQDSTCSEKVLTSQEPDQGISLNVTYTDGEPCAAGRKVIAKVIQRLRSDPPKVSPPVGSLIGVDACKLVGKSTLAAAVGEDPTVSPYGLHGCISTASDGSGGAVTVNFGFSYPPTKSGNARNVKLTGSINAIRTITDESSARCTFEWEHKDFPEQALGNDDGESVRVDYSNYTDKEDADDACEKASRLAKSVAGKLPAA